MLVDLCLDLVASEFVDLTDLGSARDGLAERHIQKSEFSADRGLDGQIVLSSAYHLHVKAHILKTLLHLTDLHASVEAVLSGTLLYKFQSSCSEFIVLLCCKILFAGNQLFLVESLVLLVFPAQPLHLDLKLEFILLYAQSLLLHGDHGVAEKVLLFCQFSLGI